MSFEFFIFSDQAPAGDGLALVIHADPRGAGTPGTAGGGMGYEGAEFCDLAELSRHLSACAHAADSRTAVSACVRLRCG